MDTPSSTSFSASYHFPPPTDVPFFHYAVQSLPASYQANISIIKLSLLLSGLYCHISAGCIMPLRLRSPRHHAAIFVFSASTHRASIPPYVGILAWRPPHYLYTVAYGMCSVPPHIPYPSASLRECSYASVALQPLPAASTFPPALPIYFFLKFSFPCGNILSLKSAFIIEGLSVLEEQVSPA